MYSPYYLYYANHRLAIFPWLYVSGFSCRSPDLSFIIYAYLPDFSVVALRHKRKLPNYSGGPVPDSHRLPSSLLLLAEHGSDLVVIDTVSHALKHVNHQNSATPGVLGNGSTSLMFSIPVKYMMILSNPSP